MLVKIKEIYHTIPYHTIPHHTIPYHTIPYHAIQGYDWNKYNRTHYDVDNPPPKVVQGYKFNIFFPDLLDKNKTPTYTVVWYGMVWYGMVIYSCMLY